MKALKKNARVYALVIKTCCSAEDNGFVEKTRLFSTRLAAHSAVPSYAKKATEWDEPNAYYHRNTVYTVKEMVVE